MGEMIDVAGVRGDTPGCAEVIHFNNAGASLQPLPVLDAVREHVELEARIGGYAAADRVTDRIEAVYDQVASLIGADRDEIAYTDGATRGWELAFHAIPLKPGDRILTTSSEYESSAIAFSKARRAKGVKVEVIPDATPGQLSLEALAQMIDEGPVRLIAINHMPTHDGLINPAAEVGALAREAGALYLLDACQSVGYRDLDVNRLGCDILSATGRKHLRGPRGTGILYVRRALLDRLDPSPAEIYSSTWTGPDTYEVRDDARRFEAWERFLAAQLGLGAAAAYARRIGVPAIERRTTELGRVLREALGEIDGVTVRDRGAYRSGIVTFTVAGREPGEVKARLAERRINVTESRQTFRYDEGVKPAPRVRASVHYFNTEEEIAALARAVHDLGK